MQKQEYRTRINGYIRANRVKVISEDGSFIGEMETWQAIKLAQEQGLDLIEVNAKSIPPLCQVMEFGKWKYESKKEQAETKKKQKIVETKTLSFHVNTQDNDLIRQIDQGRQFLHDGNKVIFTIRLRGREMAHKHLAENKLKWLVEQFHNDINSSSPIAFENKTMSVMFFPKIKRPAQV